MTTFNGVAISGVNDILAAFNRLDKSMGRNILSSVANKGAKPMAVKARELAPRDTGYLATHGITVRKTSRKMKYGESSVTYRKGAAHAILQEYGVKAHMINGHHHPGHKAQPFFRPAYEAEKDNSIAIMTAELKSAILEAARR